MTIKIKSLKTLTSDTRTPDSFNKYILDEIRNEVVAHSVIPEVFAVAKLNGKITEELKHLKVESVVPFMLEWNKKLPLTEDQQYFNAPFDYTYDLGYFIESVTYEIINSFADGNFLLLDLETRQIFPYKLERGFEIYQV